MTDKTMTTEEVAELVRKMFETGATLKNLRGLDARDMEVIYSVAHGFYSEGKYEEAERAFQFLCLYDHTNARYWMAFGACEQMLKKYESAIRGYAQSFAFNADDPWPLVRTAECRLALGDLGSAESALTVASIIADMEDGHDDAKVRIGALTEAVDRRKQAAGGQAE